MHEEPKNPSLAWRLTILFTGVIAATYAFGVYLFPALIPDMRQSLGFSYADTGVIAAFRQVAFLVTALFSAAAVLRFGAGWVILGSVLLCGLALCGVGLAGSTWTAAGLLIVLNAFAASAWIPMVSLVARVVGYRHQGKAVGLVASGTNYGLCLNGLLVPALLPAFGWRSVWFTAGGLTLLLSGGLWLTLNSASLLSSYDRGLRHRAAPLRAIVQARHLTVYSLAFLGGLAGVPFANYVSVFIRDDLHRTVTLSGEAWLAMGVAGAVGGVLFGAVGDKIGLRRALAMAAALLAASAIIVATGASSALLIFAAACFGASFFSIFGLLPAYIAKTTDTALTPAICGVAECSLGLGGALGSFLGGLSPHLLGSFHPVYVGAAIIAATMIGLSSLLPRESDSFSASSGPNSGLTSSSCDPGLTNRKIELEALQVDLKRNAD